MTRGSPSDPIATWLRQARTLEAEAEALVDPDLRASLRASLPAVQRGSPEGLYQETLRKTVTGPAKALLSKADTLYWQVVTQMLPWLRGQAKAHGRRVGLPFADALQSACLGCYRAALRFDPTRGFCFITYAQHWVRQSVDRAKVVDLDLHYGIVRVTSGEHPIQLALRLDAPTGEDGSIRWRDQLVAASPDILADLEHQGAMQQIQGLLDQLPPRQREVLLAYAGGETFAAIGKRFGVSRERVRQIHLLGLEAITKQLKRDRP